MADQKSNTTSTSAMSRRSARTFVEEQDAADAALPLHLASSETRVPGLDDRERDKMHQPVSQREQRSASSSISLPAGLIPMVDLGKDMSRLFPSTVEDMGKQGTDHILSQSQDI